MAQQRWEAGRVSANIIFGTIVVGGGEADVFFSPPAVRPGGYWPPIGQRVEFVRYHTRPDWAKLVRAV